MNLYPSRRPVLSYRRALQLYYSLGLSNIYSFHTNSPVAINATSEDSQVAALYAVLKFYLFSYIKTNTFAIKMYLGSVYCFVIVEYLCLVRSPASICRSSHY